MTPGPSGSVVFKRANEFQTYVTANRWPEKGKFWDVNRDFLWAAPLRMAAPGADQLRELPLAQCINLAAILILYSPVLAHRQPLAISRGYPIIASLNYALAT
jgi:hypothetical protein